MYYVYILLLNNKQLYTRSTGNLKQRYVQHQKGASPSTRLKRPLHLLHYEGYGLKSDAQRREKFLKTTEGKRLLRQQIKDILIEHKII